MTVLVHEGWADGGASATEAVVGGAAAQHAIMCREHEAELCHAAAKDRAGLQQVDMDTGLGQVDRRAHAPHAAADD